MKKGKLRNWLLGGCAIVVVGLGGAELATRATGVVDFPVYQVDDEIGYVLAPSQSGTFLNRNSWTLNEKSINAGPWEPNADRDILLVGDSLVWGGNPQDQSDRLGAQIEKILPDWAVWPISAGSWSVGNQLVYFERNPDVLEEGDIIVWVLNGGDLSPSSQWKFETTHPRSRPASALLHSFQKYVKPRIFKRSPQQHEPNGIDVEDDNSRFDPKAISQFSAFVASESDTRDVKFLFIAYPGKSLVSGEDDKKEMYETFLDRLEQAAGRYGVVYDLRDSAVWTPDLYRDGSHPNVEGNRVLAGEIVRLLRENRMVER